MQKPDDIDGQCPFVASGMKCQYGLSCRFFGTHKAISGGNSDGEQKNSEFNFFNKETQRLLWKNNMTFVKADAKLKSLGLMVIKFYGLPCFLSCVSLTSVMLLFTPISFSMRHDYYFSWAFCLIISIQFLGTCQKKQCCSRE